MYRCIAQIFHTADAIADLSPIQGMQGSQHFSDSHLFSPPSEKATRSILFSRQLESVDTNSKSRLFEMTKEELASPFIFKSSLREPLPSERVAATPANFDFSRYHQHGNNNNNDEAEDIRAVGGGQRHVRFS